MWDKNGHEEKEIIFSREEHCSLHSVFGNFEWKKILEDMEAEKVDYQNISKNSMARIKRKFEFSSVVYEESGIVLSITLW